MYPQCTHCKRKYVSEYFLHKHLHTCHLSHYVTFVQQRWRFLRLMNFKKNVYNALTAKVIHSRYTNLKRATTVVKTIYLENTYKLGGKGYKRLVHKWNCARVVSLIN